MSGRDCRRVGPFEPGRKTTGARKTTARARVIYTPRVDNNNNNNNTVGLYGYKNIRKKKNNRPRLTTFARQCAIDRGRQTDGYRAHTPGPSESRRLISRSDASVRVAHGPLSRTIGVTATAAGVVDPVAAAAAPPRRHAMATCRPSAAAAKRPRQSLPTTTGGRLNQRGDAMTSAPSPTPVGFT